jgi:hypothetical protein
MRQAELLLRECLAIREKAESGNRTTYKTRSLLGILLGLVAPENRTTGEELVPVGGANAGKTGMDLESLGMRMRFTRLAVAWMSIIATTRAGESPLVWVGGDLATRSNTQRDAGVDAMGSTRLADGGRIASRTEVNQPGDTERFAANDSHVLTGRLFPILQDGPGRGRGAAPASEPGGTWSFAPRRDPFSSAALLDLRNLNEKYAGEHGFIGLSRDGNGFVRGDGEPIRFWGGTTSFQSEAHHRKNREILLHHARFLAKRGVNIVRHHGAIQPKREGSRVTDVDENELDQIYRLVAAMKPHGIYTIISPCWPGAIHPQKSWGVADAENGTCTGLLFFDPALQAGYKAWLRRIFASVNPYTGVRLANDPAVAIIQLQNEDSLLFWTMQTIKGQALRNLCKLYGEWLLKKYGGMEEVRNVWSGCRHPADDLASGMPGLFIVWELTQDARNKKGDGNGRAARMADEAEFLGRLMFNFNREIARYLREELGCRQLINAGNWRSADQVVLDDVERWSYTANEIIGKNHYFATLHQGANSGWQVARGQTFASKSFIPTLHDTPLSVRQVVGHPFIIPESLWVPPTRYEAEGPLIVAAQSSLTGLDIFFWFATGAEEWQPLRPNWLKFIFSTPMTLGQFPAAALMFRKAYVREGSAVVHEERRLQDLWDRRLPLIAESGAWDPNRDVGQMPTGTPFKRSVDPLAFLVGRVEVVYGGDPSKSKAVDLAPYIDPAKKRVRSVTGEIEIDLDRGLYQVNAPKVQGVAGMLGKAGRLKMNDVMIASTNEYGCVIVASLDDKPIATSGRLLVQIGTIGRPTGWKETPARIPTEGGARDGSRIVDVGGPPWQIEKMRGALAVRNPSITRAIALDPNGMPASDIPIWRNAEEIRISLPSSNLYVYLDSAQP